MHPINSLVGREVVTRAEMEIRRSMNTGLRWGRHKVHGGSL